MSIFWIVGALALMVLLVSWLCFRMAFLADRSKETDMMALGGGEIYRPYQQMINGWIQENKGLVKEEMEITSFDGLTLHGKYYECVPGGPVELMFHGYRGNAERDLSGGVKRCFSLGHNALIVDQRCAGKSGGNVITFGIREHRDCLAWVDYAVDHFGPDVKLILTGISMGASTVLMASGCALPGQVVGVLADCGFTSARDIIREVIRQMGLPVGISYPFVKLGAKLFGGFELEETSAVEAVKSCRVPVIFFHGEDDNFVPCAMSRALYDACLSRKRLVTIPGAGHGLSYPVAPEAYVQAMREFFHQEQIVHKVEGH